ncbi:MAG TPA: asparagine synthase (glutamine-hydrolyzing) [Longimicrobium sp.]
MCGICGTVDLTPGAVCDAAALGAMTRSLAHRGPDDEGTWCEGGVGLGQARLSIIDLSSAGHQPMRSGDGTAVMAYNGEVYNFPELRRELEALGARFRSRTDTEVVLQAWLAWGPAAFSRLNGMFALALYDGRTRRVVLARDRFGIKPLYYARRGTAVAFASEVKSLIAGGMVSPDVDPQALHEYLWYGNALGERTLYAGVRRLLPGHWMEIGERGIRIEAYWRPEEIAPVADSAGDAAARVLELLDASVRRHLIADVPVGVFLSGGIDSSAITALASRHAGRLATYSVGFDFAGGVDELPRARSVAKRFGTEHHELHLAGGDLPEVIRALVRSHDEPFADAANLPLYLLAQRVRSEVKVVLQGDGGDEIFAGYRRYAVLSAGAAWRALGPAAVALSRLAPPSLAARAARARRFALAAGERDDALRMALLLTAEDPGSDLTALLSPAWRARLQGTDPFAAYRAADARFAGLDPVQRMLYTDTQVLLPCQFLEKVDKSTMAHGVEVRVPFLDAELAEYAMGLPARLKVRRGAKKWILRQALRGVVPDFVLDAPKTGFGVPFGHWLRTSLAPFFDEVLGDPAVQRAGLFEPRALARRVAEHRSGARDHGFLLWKILHLALWQQEYLAAPARAPRERTPAGLAGG